MKVSVVIPCYNLGRYLDEAVDSVLAQTFQDLEIVIVDDGSTEDETRRIVSGYRKPKTRVVRSPNRGLPAAKNLGLAETTGPYVCMLDADDRLERTMIEKSVAALDADPSIAFVSHWLRNFGDEAGDWTPERCDFPALLDMNTVNGAALVRRHALEAVGGFDEAMRDGCEDWDIWITLVEHGFPGRILPEVLFFYRRRADSMSRVMMRGEGHPRLYGRLVEKHARTFAQHLGALAARREGDIATLRGHSHDLALERYAWLEPEITKWRSDVEMLERKAARAERQRADAEARAELQAAVARAETAAARAEAARESAERGIEDERARASEEKAQADAALRDAHAEHDRTRAEHDRTRAEHDRTRAEHDRTRGERDTARAERDTARAERDQHAQALELARQRAMQIHADFNRAQDEADRLRSSISWRATAPLRAIYSGLRRMTGRR